MSTLWQDTPTRTLKVNGPPLVYGKLGFSLGAWWTPAPIRPAIVANAPRQPLRHQRSLQP
jgi:hypothetical protein